MVNIVEAVFMSDIIFTQIVFSDTGRLFKRP